MIEFVKRLFGPGPKPVDRKIDPHVAAAALLVEAALVDGIYANLESDQIAEILVDSFDLDAKRADAILAEAETLAEQATGAHQFTQHVKALPESERISVIRALYQVSLADGATCKFEEAYVRHVASLLHVDDVTRAHARQAAEARLAN